MAVTTMELRNVLKHSDFELFDFDYKIDDLQWKEDLEDIIINRFYFEEIGVESIDRFKFLFESKMKRIMPYYNELYNTTLFDGDPLTTQKLTETLENLQDTTSTTDNDNTGTQTVTGNNEDSTRSSDYPQQQDPSNDIISGHQVSEGNSTQTREDNLKHKQERKDEVKQDQKRIIEGYQRIPYPELLAMHRNTIIRINERIINELKPLFIMVY